MSDSLDPDVLREGKHAQKDGVKGTIKCNNSNFGDPIPGYKKQCVCVSMK